MAVISFLIQAPDVDVTKLLFFVELNKLDSLSFANPVLETLH